MGRRVLAKVRAGQRKNTRIEPICDWRLDRRLQRKLPVKDRRYVACCPEDPEGLPEVAQASLPDIWNAVRQIFP